MTDVNSQELEIIFANRLKYLSNKLENLYLRISH